MSWRGLQRDPIATRDDSDITVDPADSELVNAAILIAHGLGLEVIAEGVETVEQLKYLREQGCESAQGYIFSKPLAGELTQTPGSMSCCSCCGSEFGIMVVQRSLEDVQFG